MSTAFDVLKHVTTATITTMLLKKGIRRCWMSGPKPLVPQGERKASYPFVRITGLGLGPCPIQDHACLVVRVGATELGFAFPKDKLKEFAKWLATAEIPGP